MAAHVASRRRRWQGEKEFILNLTQVADELIGAEMTPELPTPSAGYPLRSLEEFAQLLMKHRLMHECAWFDPEGYDGGATLERLSRAFHEATDNGKLTDRIASSEARQAAADGHHLWAAFIAFTIKQGYDGEPTMDDSRDRELFEAFVGGWQEAQQIAKPSDRP